MTLWNWANPTHAPLLACHKDNSVLLNASLNSFIPASQHITSIHGSAAAQSTLFKSGTGTNLTLFELFKDKQKDKILLLSPVLGSEHHGW